MYVHDFNGRFLSKVKFPETPWMINKLGDNYIAYNAWYNRIKGRKNMKELYLVNLEGEVVKSMPTTVKDEKEDRLMIEQPFFYNYDNKLYYKNTIREEVFLVEPGLSLNPAYSISTGKQERSKDDFKDMKKYDDYLLIRNIFENGRIILVTYSHTDGFHYLLVDKQTWTPKRAGSEVSGFTEDLNSGPLFRPYYMSSSNLNVLISILNPGNIEKEKKEFENVAHKHPTLSGRQPDDNPVIVIAEMK